MVVVVVMMIVAVIRGNDDLTSGPVVRLLGLCARSVHGGLWGISYVVVLEGHRGEAVAVRALYPTNILASDVTMKQLDRLCQASPAVGSCSPNTGKIILHVTESSQEE